MNKQEAFNKAWRGVVKQGKKSRADEGECRYKMIDADGKELRCGVGHLLTDEQLSLLGSMNPPAGLGLMIFLDDTLIDGDEREAHHFLYELQKAHDDVGHAGGEAFIKEFKERMSDLAADAGLTIPTDI